MSPIRPTGDICDCVTGGDDATGALNTRSLEYIRGAAAAALPFSVLSECCGEWRTIVADTSGGDADDAYGRGIAGVRCGDGTTVPYGLCVGNACGGPGGIPFVNDG